MAFRKHSVAVARKEVEVTKAQASKKFPAFTPAWHAETFLINVKTTVDFGLFDCYEHFSEYLPDLFADLPWNPVGMQETVRLILADSRLLDLAASTFAVWNVDLIDELKSSLVS